jgi:tetratricopeptide (TPR) repeat protein
MRVVVSSICLNESPEFIARWSKSAMDADEQILVDTGSTNDAVTCARDLGITVHEITVRPWRFDTARTAALALLPADCDVVVKLDVDEVLQDGWRDALENAPKADRYSYRYIWNHTPDGEPDVEFAADHTITRFGWRWRHPVHEALYWTGDERPVTVFVPGMVIEHHADDTKSRGQYLPLLARATQEAPGDDRMAAYLAREYLLQGRWAEARVEFERHLALPAAVWPAERAQSYRYLAQMDTYPERWLLKAVAEDPSRRDAMVDMVDLLLKEGRTAEAAGWAARALRIRQPMDYMTNRRALDDSYLANVIAGSTHG